MSQLEREMKPLKDVIKETKEELTDLIHEVAVLEMLVHMVDTKRISNEEALAAYKEVLDGRTIGAI